MSEISAQLVKQLREATGAGMMECKKALVEANGNLEEAIVILRKRGLASAAKKSSRATKQGLIVTHLGLLFWETRFVSATLAFPGLKPSLEER